MVRMAVALMTLVTFPALVEAQRTELERSDPHAVSPGPNHGEGDLALAGLGLPSSPSGDLSAAVVQESTSYTAFSSDAFHRAYWLAPSEAQPAHTGYLAAFGEATEAPPSRSTAHVFDELRVVFEGPAPSPGTGLLTFRVERRFRAVGAVVSPTGVLTVLEASGSTAVARVDKLYDWMGLGDLVDVLPTFPLRPGVAARPVAGAMEAEIIGFGEPHQIQSLGHYVFLGSGSNEGIGVGDLFEVVRDAQGGAPEADGRLQVVRVAPDHATARVVHLTNPVFWRGVVVRLSGRMQ